MTIGLATFELHLSESRSLKEKRMVIARIRDRLRGRYNVSVAEIDYQDLWQRALLAVVSVGSARGPVDSTLRKATAEIERHLPGEVIDRGVDYLALDAGGDDFDDFED